MTAVRILPSGPRALLVELPGPAERAGLVASLAAAPLPGVAEVVPAARTVQLLLDGTVAPADVAAAIRGLSLLAPETGADDAAEPLVLGIRYDGPDLAHVAELLGVDTSEVIRRHTQQVWTCDFLGFLPGFAYLTGEHDDLDVPRRESPRTRVPAGSVGLAGPVTGVYPSASPGGWQLIGSCDVAMFDVERTPPALLAPGTRVRFEEVW